VNVEAVAEVVLVYFHEFLRAMALKPLSKAEVNRLKPADVHNVLSKLILADGFDIVYDMVIH